MNAQELELYRSDVETAIAAFNCTATGAHLAFVHHIRDFPLYVEGDTDVEEGQYRLRAAILAEQRSLDNILDLIGE